MSQLLDESAHLVYETSKPVPSVYYCEARLYIVKHDGIVFLVEAANPAEAKERTTALGVVHGRWIGIEFDGYADGLPVYDLYECSECGYEHEGEDDTLTAYCPSCGAKMDGDAPC